MTWLTRSHNESGPPGKRFAERLRLPGIVTIPGVYDGLSAMLAKKAGFEFLYLSGAAITASRGLPDLGVLTLDELISVTRNVYRVVDLPLVVDADTGYGGIVNVVRVVRELEEAGAAAIQIEDQARPKKCGHLSDKRLVEPDEMAARINAAKGARTHLRVIARTDAVASEGIDSAVRRARLYLEAGADVIFPEALTSEDMFREFAGAIDAPLLANMTEFGKTPNLSARQFEDLGYKMAIWPVSALRVAAKAMEELYAGLMADGTVEAFLDRMQTRRDLYDLIGYHEYEALDRNIARSVLPEDDKL